VNYAVNNDGAYYPRITASYASAQASPAGAIDGNYWYHVSPPNRWTCEGSPNSKDWIAVDFGMPRKIDTIKLYVLDDRVAPDRAEGTKQGGAAAVVPPAAIEVEVWDGKDWIDLAKASRTPPTSIAPRGRRANTLRFAELETSKVRARFTHDGAGRTGLTELEVWGVAARPVAPAPAPEGNYALNVSGRGFPKATASWTSRFDKVEMANDGRISFRGSPHNRWTAYESPNASDWLQIDFGADQGTEKTVGRVDLHLYDDRGGVQAAEKYAVEYWDGKAWSEVADARPSPEKPAGGVVNTVVFKSVRTSKLRVVFTHRGKSRSGLTEIEIWEK
jgi:hypothetical protein